MSTCLSADKNDQNQTSENIRQSSCRRHSWAVCLIISNFSNWNLFVIWVLLFGAYLDILTNSINKYFYYGGANNDQNILFLLSSRTQHGFLRWFR